MSGAAMLVIKKPTGNKVCAIKTVAGEGGRLRPRKDTPQIHPPTQLPPRSSLSSLLYHAAVVYTEDTAGEQHI